MCSSFDGWRRRLYEMLYVVETQRVSTSGVAPSGRSGQRRRPLAARVFRNAARSGLALGTLQATSTSCPGLATATDCQDDVSRPPSVSAVVRASHGEDDLSLGVSFSQVSESVGDLAELVTLLHDRGHLPCLEQLAQGLHVLPVDLRDEEHRLLAATQ